MDRVSIVIPWPIVNEGDRFGANLYFVDRDGETIEAPTTIDYRVDDITTRGSSIPIRGWTTAAVGDSSSIDLASSDNALQSRYNKTERRLLTVCANRGLSSQVRGRVEWTIRNQDFYP